MILVADSGSTKTDWVLANEKQQVKSFRTPGYNPYFTDSESIYYSLSDDLLKDLDVNKVSAVFFYGAGCMAPEKKEIVRQALVKAFPGCGDIHVEHDLLGAARALLGKEPGFAAILGTGANTCLYDGEQCTMNIDSLGYLLGDEGSGSYIGRKLLRDHMRGQLPAELQKPFREQFRLKDNETIFHTLYNTQYPNRFLADFCRFASEHTDHPYIRNKVRDAFTAFFKNLVGKYPDHKKYSFNCIGSVAETFRDILEETALNFDMRMGKIIRAPIEGIVKYHQDPAAK